MRIKSRLNINVNTIEISATLVIYGLILLPLVSADGLSGANSNGSTRLCLVDPPVYMWLSKNEVVHLKLTQKETPALFLYDLATHSDNPVAKDYANTKQFRTLLASNRAIGAQSQRWMEWSARSLLDARKEPPAKLRVPIPKSFLVYEEATSISNRMRLWVLSAPNVGGTTGKAGRVFRLAVTKMDGSDMRFLAIKMETSRDQIPFIPARWRPSSADVSFVINHQLFVLSAKSH